MKTLLVVEDEKMIRRGICTIAKRSGVPIEEILECSNGQEAYELLQTTHVDVMFTDIRMPKMDGIELVRAVSRMENPPICVAISGYDDFSYAVEMMRNGVREYILKPVDREKIKDILVKIDGELAANSHRERTELEFGKQQLRYLLTNEPSTGEEIEVLKTKLGDGVFPDEFYVCCGCTDDNNIQDSRGWLVINSVGDSNVYIVDKTGLEDMEKAEDSALCLGVSSPHRGIEYLRDAYREALEARRIAFCKKENYFYGTKDRTAPQLLLDQSSKLLEETAMNRRLQLIGTERTDELIGQWDKFFNAVEKGHIREEHFEAAQERFIEDVSRTYRNSIEEEDYVKLQEFRHTLLFNSIADYREALMNWILKLNAAIGSQDDYKLSDQKIKKAIAYIKENYNSDINMAVVSNYVSMNYSLFSFSFKQFTGQNFVNYLKDLRMAEAMKMLAETDMKVIEISQCVGYEDEKHFMKLFKSTYGVSPTEYRKNMQRQ